MNNAQMSARVGLFFLMGIALIWVTFESLNGGKVANGKGYTLVAYFKNLKEIRPGDEVRVAGVKVGTVKATRLDGRRARAELLIDPAVQIAQDATATIGMAGLLGSNYVAFDLGSDNTPAYPAGSEVHTLDTADLNTIVSELSNVGKKVDTTLGQISGDDGVLGKISTLVDENRTQIRDVTTNLQQITGKINQGEGTLGRLVNDPKLHDELLATVAEIKTAAAEAKTFVAQAESVIDQVKSGQGTLGVLLYDQQAGDNIKAVTTNLRDISDKISKGQGTLGKLINDDGLYLQAQGSLKKLDRTLDGMADSGPISAVGTAASALF
ncbi:MAG: MCE family protein [Opitutaceae bacterium]|nr:MCE family protein [Opitutaceae bacterium]